MTDEHKLRQQARRGDRAREILQDELTQDAFKLIEAQLFQQWMATKPDEEATRERLYRLMLAHQDYKGVLETALSNGEFAKNQLTGQPVSRVRRLING